MKSLIALCVIILISCGRLRKDVVTSSASSTANSVASMGSNANSVVNSNSVANNISYMQYLPKYIRYFFSAY